MVAFGGNALWPDPGYPGSQEERADRFSEALFRLLQEGEGAALVHGNGPQVGMILLRIEATRDRFPPESLDVMVAETQGSIGYLLARSLRSALARRGRVQEVAAAVTQVAVDPGDPAFSRPTKPVGPCYPDDQAREIRERCGWPLMKTPRGWRRLVASPRPLQVVEMHTIADAVSHGHILIAGGGGGVPVVQEEDGSWRGVEAVVDKDLTAALMACSLKARMLAILTDVPAVFLRFGRPDQEALPRLSTAAARRLLEEREFPPGSMGPKVEAAVRYAEAMGHKALITDVEHLAGALEGRDGTWVER
ncbi:MAG: carbamate kinase [Methanosarcinales archaeon]|nr:carbamate kinase [Methanosarcinales archaeon]